jgi:hypothetical protein
MHACFVVTIANHQDSHNRLLLTNSRTNAIHTIMIFLLQRHGYILVVIIGSFRDAHKAISCRISELSSILARGIVLNFKGYLYSCWTLTNLYNNKYSTTEQQQQQTRRKCSKVEKSSSYSIILYS